MIHIDSPLYLALIFPIFFVWFLFFREKIGHISPNSLIRKYTRIPRIMHFVWILRFMILCCLLSIPAWMSYTWLQKETSWKEDQIMIVLDISRSMLATDILPDRITWAKDTIHTFLNNRKGEKIWLILFAWKAFLNIPFSDDYSGIESIISHITPYTIRQENPWLSGTAIWDALLLALDSMRWKTLWEKSIILFTDGRANMGIDPEKVIKDLDTRIPIYTVWIWTLSGGAIPWWWVYEWTWATELDEDLLMRIGENTHGKYFRINESLDLVKSVEEIEDQVWLNEWKIVEKTIFLDAYFLILSLFLIGLERLLIYFFRKRYKLL